MLKRHPVISATALFASLFAASLASAAEASAEERASSRVTVTYGSDTAGCPDTESVRARILSGSAAARSDGPLLEVVIERAGDDYQASVRHDGRVRTLRSKSCAEVTDAAAWVATLALVEASVDPPNPPPPSESKVTMTVPMPMPPPTRTADVPATPVSPHRDLEALVSAGALIGAGYVPNAWPGASLALGIRGAYWSAAIEGRYFPRSPLDVPEMSSRVHVSTAAASVVPCGRYAPLNEIALSGCGIMTAGATVGEAPDFHFAPPAEPIFLVGGRAAVEVRPHASFAVGLTGTVEVAALDTPVSGFDRDTPRTLWVAPLVAGAGGVETIAIF